jgi:hypothetical protein
VRIIFSVVFLCTVIPGVCQTTAKYQVATVVTVNPHPVPAGTDTSPIPSDISLKVGNTVYVVLYTPPPGSYGVKYSAGLQLLVLVGSKTITYNDILGRSMTVPIVSHKTVSGGPKGH